MKKAIIWILGTLVVLVGIGIIGLQYLKSQTKSLSPESEVSYEVAGIHIDVFYCRPSARGRKVFGASALVPFQQVWRTGANEATTFVTETDIVLGGQEVPAGNYTLWTIPDVDTWQVILNKKQYSWGVNFEGVASREPEFDVLNVEVPVTQTERYVEMFTIDVDDEGLIFDWENTHVVVPLGKKDSPNQSNNESRNDSPKESSMDA
jgi:hypothetical protein